MTRIILVLTSLVVTGCAQTGERQSASTPSYVVVALPVEDSAAPKNPTSGPTVADPTRATAAWTVSTIELRPKDWKHAGTRIPFPEDWQRIIDGETVILDAQEEMRLICNLMKLADSELVENVGVLGYEAEKASMESGVKSVAEDRWEIKPTRVWSDRAKLEFTADRSSWHHGESKIDWSISMQTRLRVSQFAAKMAKLPDGKTAILTLVQLTQTTMPEKVVAAASNGMLDSTE